MKKASETTRTHLWNLRVAASIQIVCGLLCVVPALKAQPLEPRYRDPANWLSYDRDNTSRRYSPLTEINRDSIAKLKVDWVFQYPRLPPRSEATPLVKDGYMYLTVGGEEGHALDARNGRPIWEFLYVPEDADRRNNWNRGFAMLGDRAFMATSDGRLVALDARTGNRLWTAVVSDVEQKSNTTGAPFVVNDLVIIGVRGGDLGSLRGYLDAYSVSTGELVWRINTIPAPGQPGHETWPADNDSWKRGGGSTWTTGAYDPELDLLYWPIGNPGPNPFSSADRNGDNLYTNSLLALRPETGEIVWHYQFTPQDTHDWDANETPVLADIVIDGKERKLVLQANRNAFFYTLDRATGEFLNAAAFAKQDWATGFTSEGRPIVREGTEPTPEGVRVCPDINGGTNWHAPAYNPEADLFYVVARDHCLVYHPTGGSSDPADPPAYHALRALDPLTGAKAWGIPLISPGDIVHAGAMTTAGGLVFFSSREGQFIAADAKSGEVLWHFNLGGTVRSSPISYATGGKQYVAIVSKSAVFAFALPSQ